MLSSLDGTTGRRTQRPSHSASTPHFVSGMMPGVLTSAGPIAHGRRGRTGALLLPLATVAVSAFLSFEATSLTVHMFVKLLVVLAGLVVAVAALRRPHWALFALPVLAAFDRPVSAVGWSVQLTTLTLAAFAPALASQWRSATLRPAVAWGAAALTAGAVGSCFFALEFPSAIAGAVTWALVVNMILGGLGIITQRPTLLAYLAVEIAFLGAVVSTLGWLQERGIYTVVGPSYVPDRIDSSFGWYTVYGSFVAMATVVAIGTALALASLGRPLLAMVSATCAAISGYGTFISMSRGAVLCLAVGVVVLLLAQVRRPLALLGAAFAVAAIGVVPYLLTPPAVVAQLVARFRDTQGGDSLRSILQAAGRTLLMRNPQGIGVGGFQTAAEAGTVASGTDVLYHCHQMYVQLGLDLGWLGLVGFLLLVYAGVSSARHALSDRSVSVRTAFTAALIGSVLQGFNDYLFYETGWMILFGVILLGSLTRTPAGEAVEHGERRLTEAALS